MKLAPPAKSVNLSNWKAAAIMKKIICIATVTIPLIAKWSSSMRTILFAAIICEGGLWMCAYGRDSIAAIIFRENPIKSGADPFNSRRFIVARFDCDFKSNEGRIYIYKKKPLDIYTLGVLNCMFIQCYWMIYTYYDYLLVLFNKILVLEWNRNKNMIRKNKIKIYKIQGGGESLLFINSLF